MSLLPAGVVRAQGAFRRGDMVRVFDLRGVEFAKGLANYDAAETRRLLGRNSADIEGILGYANEPELVHRDNLVVSDAAWSPQPGSARGNPSQIENPAPEARADVG